MSEEAERLLREMVDREERGQLHPLPPEVEALGWYLASHLGLIDSLGGNEWSSRVEDGSVSAAAQAILRSISDEFRTWRERGWR